MTLVSTANGSSEKIKISSQNTRLKLVGSKLEIMRESQTNSDHTIIDLSRVDMVIKGVDSDDYIIIECKQTTKPVFDLSRTRMDQDVAIPTSFFEYLTYDATNGNGKYVVYVNERKHFLLRVETPKGVRIHNLGELGDPTSYMGRFYSLFENFADWLHRGQIKDMLYKERMYDGQKMTIGLKILKEEKLIKRKDGLYGHRSLEDDTGVPEQYGGDIERQEDLAIVNTLDARTAK